MIVLVALVLGVIGLFGTGAARVALADLAVLEAQDAAQRAAEAAVGVCADLIVAGASTDAEIDAAARSEAQNVATINAARGTVDGLSVTRGSSATDLVNVQVTAVVRYGGFAGPITITSTGSARVPRSP